jgi:hypothetical protein
MREWYARRTFEERREMRHGRNMDEVRRRDRKRHERMKDDPTYMARRSAVLALNAAVKKGEIVRQPCEVCGADAQAHHDDYSRPLDVRWLCTKHHAEHHTSIP